MGPFIVDVMTTGRQDIFTACVDGLKSFLEAIEAAFPKTPVQLCIADRVRYRLNFVNWKLCKAAMTMR